MSLVHDYCKEIAKQLGQTAVYLPGSKVELGDIISFKDSTFFGTPKPIGEFTIHANLSHLNINLAVKTEQSASQDSYVYASKGSVNVEFNLGADLADKAEGKLTIGFKKEGALYFSAVDCIEKRFQNILDLGDMLAPYKEKYDWDDFFIVVGVTTAKRALIMQSNSSDASLEITGEVKNLTPTSAIGKDLSANLSLKVTKHKDSSLFKDWSDECDIFFTLVRYRKKILGSWGVETNKNKGFFTIEAKNKNVEYIVDLVEPLDII